MKKIIYLACFFLTMISFNLHAESQSKPNSNNIEQNNLKLALIPPPQVRRTPPRRPVAQPRFNYKTIKGKRMRLYVTNAGFILRNGQTCYAESHGFGKVKGNNCCLSSECYSSFYVPDS